MSEFNPCYYGVIGNRDHIKINKGKENEEKLPFWYFLDKQPDGWLSSLAYLRKEGEYPEFGKPMIWDCGAWSYKGEDKPKYSPEQALDLYARHALMGDLIIAPDHMLIPETNLDARRKINAEYAREFLNLTKYAQWWPMAVIHGMDTNERITNAIWLSEIGYEYLAIGGIAARASQKRVVVETVSRLRDAAPNAYLHVLGLSSPEYARMWKDIGIQSFDGSSHFKQAFTGGAFFSLQDGKLIKHKAARSCRETFQPLEPITAPECYCKACSWLRNEGIDTRTYGSNENNMGRAAHNMNMLMRAQKWALEESHLSLV